jgi:hypothetical protein
MLRLPFPVLLMPPLLLVLVWSVVRRKKKPRSRLFLKFTEKFIETKNPPSQ